MRLVAGARWVGYSRSMPDKRANVKNEKQYEGLRKKGMSKQRAARIANSPGASKRGGKKGRLLEHALELEPGRDERPEEGRGPQGRQGRCAQVVAARLGHRVSSLPRYNAGARGGVPEWPKGTGCKPVGSAFRGSNPLSPMTRSR